MGKSKEYEHCKFRAQERYGINLTYDDWKFLADLCIKENQVDKQVDGKTIQTTHIILWENVKLPVIFENSRHCITTILPPL